MARAKNDPIADFFEAADALTYREMLQVTGLLALQLECHGQDLDGITKPEVLAQALLDAGESYGEEQADAGEA